MHMDPKQTKKKKPHRCGKWDYMLYLLLAQTSKLKSHRNSVWLWKAFLSLQSKQFAQQKSILLQSNVCYTNIYSLRWVSFNNHLYSQWEISDRNKLPLYIWSDTITWIPSMVWEIYSNHTMIFICIASKQIQEYVLNLGVSVQTSLQVKHWNIYYKAMEAQQILIFTLTTARRPPTA